MIHDSNAFENNLNFLKIPPTPKCQYLGLKSLQVQKIGIEDFPTWILTLRFLKMITVKPK